jgi:hypothetical protein
MYYHFHPVSLYSFILFCSRNLHLAVKPSDIEQVISSNYKSTYHHFKIVQSVFGFISLLCPVMTLSVQIIYHYVVQPAEGFAAGSQISLYNAVKELS